VDADSIIHVFCGKKVEPSRQHVARDLQEGTIAGECMGAQQQQRLGEADRRLNRDEPGGLVHLGTVGQRLAQVWVEREARQHLRLQMEKHHHRGIGVRQSGACLVVVQAACRRAVQAQAAQTHGAHLEGKREHGPNSRGFGRGPEPRPVPPLAGVQVRAENRRVAAGRVEARPFAELELNVLQMSRDGTRCADHPLMAGVVHERHTGPTEIQGRGAVDAQQLRQRASPARVDIERREDLGRGSHASTPRDAGVASKRGHLGPRRRTSEQPGVSMSPTESPRQARPTGYGASGHSELVREIRGRGLLHPRPLYYVLLGSINLSGLAVVVAGLVLLHDSWWAILLAPLYALVSTQIAFFSHDAAHRQIARKAWATAVLCLIHGNLLNGFSYGWWLAKHNAHHAHPNDLETDPDVAAGAIVFDSGQADARTGPGAWLTRHQAGFFFPMLTLEAVNLRVSSVRAVLRPDLRYQKTECVLLLGHVTLYLTLLISTMTWLQALVFFAVHQGLFGVYLGCSFAPSHKGMPVLTPEQAADPLLRQVLVSRNIRGGRTLDVALGGLNLQIEHHLFPSMPRPNLRRAQPIIRRHCRAHGIAYSEATLLASYGMALRHLHQVGQPVPATPPQ
jgi:fatty acid desaturase